MSISRRSRWPPASTGSRTSPRSAPRISSGTGRSASFPRARGEDRSRAGISDSSINDERVTRLLPGLAPLGHRNYALYWVGQLVSMSGTWIELTATTWLLYQLTDSPFLLGLGGVFRGAPIFAFALIGGAVADRVERRRLLLITQSASVLTSLILGALVVTANNFLCH